MLSRHRCFDEGLEDCRAWLQEEFEAPNLALVFVSGEFTSDYSRLLGFLAQAYPQVHIFGCSASGFIGDGEEAELVPGFSVTLGWLPDCQLRTFHFERPTLPDLDAPPEVWREALAGEDPELRGLLLLADPFSFPGDEFLAGMDYAYPEVTKLGGLISGDHSPGSKAMFCDQTIHRSGVVGLAISGAVRVDAVVAQGCRPIGKPMVVTECAYNEILKLDGHSAGEVVLATLRALPPRDQRLASQLLFLGIGAGGPKLTYKPGDFLIRQVLGVDPSEDSLVLNATPRKGQLVQLHLRDHRSSSEDLELMLDRHLGSRNNGVTGALLFSCLGRGRALYGHCDHDSNLFKTKLGDVPLGGFFCSGEFGPVGGVTSLHSYTSCFAVFSERKAEE